VVVLANGSVGGVVGFEGAPAGSTPLAASAAAPSTVTTALIAITTSFPILGFGEDAGAAPTGPEGVEEEMASVVVARVGVGAPDLPETVSWLAATVRELLIQTAMRHSLPSNVSIAPELSSSDLDESAVGAVEAVRVRNAPLSVGPEVHSDGGDSRLVCSFLLACTALATVWYTRRREHCRQIASQGEGSRCGTQCPSPKASSTPIIGTVSRSPLTSLRMVRRLGPPAAPRSVEPGLRCDDFFNRSSVQE
jgi:hypothetical protein